jgi:hypothetical protein
MEKAARDPLFAFSDRADGASSRLRDGLAGNAPRLGVVGVWSAVGAQRDSSLDVMKLPSLSTMIGVPSTHSGQCSETQSRVAHSQMS